MINKTEVSKLEQNLYSYEIGLVDSMGAKRIENIRINVTNSNNEPPKKDT